MENWDRRGIIENLKDSQELLNVRIKNEIKDFAFNGEII